MAHTRSKTRQSQGEPPKTQKCAKPALKQQVLVSQENEAQIKNAVQDQDVGHLHGESPQTPPSKKIQGAYSQICRTEKHGKGQKNPTTVVNSGEPDSSGGFDLQLNENLKKTEGPLKTNLVSEQPQVRTPHSNLTDTQRAPQNMNKSTDSGQKQGIQPVLDQGFFPQKSENEPETVQNRSQNVGHKSESQNFIDQSSNAPRQNQIQFTDMTSDNFVNYAEKHGLQKKRDQLNIEENQSSKLANKFEKGLKSSDQKVQLGNKGLKSDASNCTQLNAKQNQSPQRRINQKSNNQMMNFILCTEANFNDQQEKMQNNATSQVNSNSKTNSSSDHNDEEQGEFDPLGQQPIGGYFNQPEILSIGQIEDGRYAFGRLDAGELLSKSDEQSKSNSYEFVNIFNDYTGDFINRSSMQSNAAYPQLQSQEDANPPRHHCSQIEEHYSHPQTPGSQIQDSFIRLQQDDNTDIRSTFKKKRDLKLEQKLGSELVSLQEDVVDCEYLIQQNNDQNIDEKIEDESEDIVQDKTMTQEDLPKQKKVRKERSDKNKKRKHPHRKIAEEADLLQYAQKVLLMQSLGLVVEADDSLRVSSMNVKMPDVPKYDPKTCYYKEYFKLYLQNENLVADIDQIANDNFKLDRRILFIKDFYDNTLIPQILTQPHKFLHRLRQQQYQTKQKDQAQLKNFQIIKQATHPREPQSATQRTSLLQETTRNKKRCHHGAFPQEQTFNSNYLSLQSQWSKRKQHVRRSAHEIEKAYLCPYSGCEKFFGSEGSQNLHIKIKHNGGTKTDREKLARMIVEAYAEAAKIMEHNEEDAIQNVVIDNEVIDKIDLNLPPGILTQQARKSGLLSNEQMLHFNEVILLEVINKRLAPKFREMICQQQELKQEMKNQMSIKE